MQGGLEFKTEIELLSRVHHKNLVGLVGFCFEQGEQMLVYEFMANGALKESLSGTFTLFQLIKMASTQMKLNKNLRNANMDTTRYETRQYLKN